MHDSERPHERWIWTELIGFDNRQSDLGVGEYLDTAGFTPHGVCLMLTSPDFVLSHQSVAQEITLPEDFCSRDGHEFNPHRQRQAWTNRQLQALLAELHARGIQAYLTVFTRFYGNRFRHEWLSDHREACMVFRHHGWASAVNCLSRLSDGSYFEDYFIPRLVEALDYYGFDGWHGADGWGPLSGPIYEVDLSDDMVAQFAEVTGLELPPQAMGPCGHDVERLEARGQWLWRNARHEWIEFYAQRWTRFWRKALEALHAAGKQALINSAWGRAPWEALYRYGVDYRRIVEAGVDGIVVETVAAGLAMDPRPYAADVTRHFDFLSMLMLMRARVPDARLIFLHNTHDVVEEWDAIRHNPTLLEKEIYSLANVFHTRGGGDLRRSADGFLVCLGDGLDDDHWRWLRRRWALAYSGSPGTALGPTLVWSHALMDAQTSDFTETRSWTVHRLLFHLMTDGAPVQATVEVEDIDAASGAILVLNHHLLPSDELDRVLGYQGGPIILIGRASDDLPPPDLRFDDRRGPMPLSCLVYGATPDEVPRVEEYEPPSFPDDVMALEEPRGYWDHFAFRPVSPSFLQACADTITAVSGGFRVIEQGHAVAVMATEQTSGRLRVAIKNKTPFYVRPTVDIGRDIASVDILTEYPSLMVRPEGSTFAVRVPGKGITVVEVTLATDA
ncbi:MAG: hypothetical protein U9R79_10090 [Armatimonadota bacterium]|nr:hypothetical protein [Armatimonadota bacterium]